MLESLIGPRTNLVAAQGMEGVLRDHRLVFDQLASEKAIGVGEEKVR